ncbi:hypothetical protein IJT10_03940 [bacterium]|nr:hypothetical protein [bacterium]
MIDNQIEDHFRWDELCGSEEKAEKADIWESVAPLCINDLHNNFYIGMSAENLQALSRDEVEKVDEGIFVYAKNAVFRVESGRVVNIAVSVNTDSKGGKDILWNLRQNDQTILTIGSTVDQCKEKLGQPICTYAKENVLKVVVYNHKTSDLGVIFLGEYVVGFMLTDSGILVEALRWSGYTLEEEK